MKRESSPPLVHSLHRGSVSVALSRRELLRLGGLLTVGAALNGCGLPRPMAATSDSDPVSLVYQGWTTDWFAPLAQEMLAQFHQDHPGVRVFYVPDPEDVEEQMLIEMQSGTAPDVFTGCCDFFPIWAQQGHTLDLRLYVEADLDQATLDEWDPAQYQAFFTEEGKQYALPKYHGALALYYNKDLFDEYGVSYPDGSWTHDDYAEAMRQLTHDRDGDGQTDLWGSMLDVSWDRIQVHVNAWGGHFVDPEDPTRSLMGEPEALAAMEWIRARMWDDKAMATFLDVQNMETRQAFINQKIAMVEDGSWALRDILANATFRVGVAPMPTGPVRRVTLATTDGFGIYADTKHPDAAWELLKFLIGPEFGRAMARIHFLQPARASLVEEWIGFIRAEFPKQTEGVDLAAFADGHLKGYSVTAEVFANMKDARQLVRATWEQLFTFGQMDTDEMRQVSQQIQAAQPARG
ncbi:MAG: sugar ABC transporter substrate-binding protein [Chloroflexota bacterium]|nr:sugar ABC transporter substrate-binding protein [Chloroflexota bacterium]